MASTSEPRYEQTPIALVGMACRLPGASNVDEFWKLLIEGRSALGELPPERFDRSLVYDPEKGARAKSYSSIGGLIEARPFNREACPVKPELVAGRDIVHLTLLDVAAEACRSGGLDPLGLRGQRVGVYIGHSRGTAVAGEVAFATLVEQTAQYLRQVAPFCELAGDRQDALIDEVVRDIRSRFPHRDDEGGPETSASMAAGLISLAFGLDGPYAVLNAACASSLQALAIGARAVELGELDMAIVGGASYCKADSLVLFSQARSVSATGSRPFDDDADGLVAAEGYVVFLVKRLDRALADGNEVFAVLRGIGVSSDGRGKSLWAPRKEGQIEAIRRAYGPGVDMASVQYIEAHATSTQVGDATEITALATAMQGQLPAGARIPMGSVKANIGHTLETAGMAGLLKTVLAMRHGVIPPQINLKKLNHNIAWNDLPFYVPTEPTAWLAPGEGVPRRAAVNSFGIGGLNVHLAVEEFLPVHARQLVAHPHRQRWADEPIAIIGCGAVLPRARRIEQLWELFASGQSAVIEAPADRLDPATALEPGSRRRWKTPTRLGGFITDFAYDWKTHKIPPKQVASADPLQFMLLDAVEQAFQQSGYDRKPFDRQRTAVVVGTGFGGDFANQLQMGMRLPDFERALQRVLGQAGIDGQQIREIGRRYGDILLKQMPALNDETGSFTTSTLASRITKTFDLMGGAVAIDGNAASSHIALSAGINALRTGQCDMLVCAAGQCALGLPTYEQFSLAGILNRGRPGSPLDADNQGFVPGEGAAVVLLKRLSDAQRDGDPIAGVIHSLAFARGESLDDAVARAAERALNQSRVAPADVTCLESGGLGLASLDAAEADGLAKAYGAVERDAPLMAGSPVGQIGFSAGCSGLVSVLKAALELEHRQIAPNVGLRQPAPWWTRHGDTLTVEAAAAPIPVANAQGRLFAGVSSLGRGNLACHLLVERGTPVATIDVASRPAVATQPAAASVNWQIARFDAASTSALWTQVRQAIDQAAERFAAATTREFHPQRPCRLAVVARSPDEMAQRLEQFLKLADARQSRLFDAQGVVFAEQTGPLRTALLFAGQGSQYPGMLERLVGAVPAAAAARDQIDAALSELGYPSFAELAWHSGDALGRDVWLTQLALLAADTLLHETVATLGIRPWCVAGHSYGEFAALVAARGWNFATAARVTQARCQAIEQSTDSAGVMLSVAAAPTDVQRCIEQAGGRLYISHHNAPLQTVVGGDASAVDRLLPLLKQAGLASRALAVPRPFHTPLLAGAQAGFAKTLESTPLEPPRTPLLSSVTNRFVADPLDIRANLVAQLVEPVRYVELIERLQSCGVNGLIEIGPQQVLTRLHRKILPDAACLILGVDYPQRDPAEQLMLVKAACETWQAPRLAPLQVNSPAPSQPAPTGATLPAQRSARRPSKGDAYQRGYRFGGELADPLRRMLRRYAALAPAGLAHERQLADSIALAEVLLDDEARDELRGMADAIEVDREALVAHNLRMYPDLAGGCCHFAVTAAANRGGGMVHGANEDLTLRLVARDAVAAYVHVGQGEGGYGYVSTPLVGQVGVLSGINQTGLSVSSSMLLDIPRAAGAPNGLLHGLVVRRILRQCASIDEAVAVVRQHPGAGGWALVISDAARDEVALVEYDGQRVETRRGQPRVVATNHAQLLPPRQAPPDHSPARLSRLQELLGAAADGALDSARATALLSDRYDPRRGKPTPRATMNTLCRVDNHASLVFEPQKRIVWTRTALPAATACDDFVPIDAGALLDQASSQPAAQEGSTGAESASKPPASAVASPPVDRTGRTCWKLVPYLEPIAEVSATNFTWHEAALVLGDNPLAAALDEQLRRRGLRVELLPGNGDAEPLLSRLDALWQTGPLPHLLITLPFDAAGVPANPADWAAYRRRAVSTPYLLCQRWFQRLLESGRVDDGSVVACVRLDGTFGWQGAVPCPNSGAWTGLVKAMDLEIGGHGLKPFRARVVDLTDELPAEQMAAVTISELESSDAELEVARRATGRFGVRLGWFPEPATWDLPATAPSPRGAWVVTGGARGVTARVAQTLGERFGLALHLIGTSPLPRIDPQQREQYRRDPKALRAEIMRDAVARKQTPAEAWSRIEKAMEIDGTLQAMAAAGLKVTYHACDVGNYQQLAEVLAEVRRADGPIRGVVHGAGYESSTRFEKKRPERVEATLASKVDGAVHLLALTRDDPLDYFIGFSSISGRLGGLGQTDYGVANELLAKLVADYRQNRPDCRAWVIDWPAWDDVGMAVRSESKQLLQMRGVGFMPAVEGCEHLLDMLAAGAPTREVVICDAHRWRRHYPAITEEQIKAAPVELSAVAAARLRPTDPLADLPLIDRLVARVPGQSVEVELRLDPVADPFLSQHRIHDRPQLPAVIGLAAMAQAASLLDPDRQVVELLDFEVPNGLRFYSDEPQTVRIVVAAEGDGARCTLVGDFRNRAGKVVIPNRVYMQLRVVLGQPAALSAPRWPQPATWRQTLYPEWMIIQHGPLLQSLKATADEDNRIMGRLETAPLEALAGDRRGGQWLVPWAELDAAFYACGVLLYCRKIADISIPAGVRRLRLGRLARPGEPVVVQVTSRAASSHEIEADIAILGDDDAPLCLIEGYRLTKVDAGGVMPAAAATKQTART